MLPTQCGRAPPSGERACSELGRRARGRTAPVNKQTAVQPTHSRERSPPYQLVASLSLALSGAAARPATAAPGLVSTVSDGLMAPTDADETERVGFVLQKLSISPTLYEAPNRPEPAAEHSSPGSVESAPGCDRLVPSSNPVGPAAGRVGSPELPGLPSLAGDFGEAVVAAGTDDIAAVTSTLQNIRLELAQGAAATRVQRAMRVFMAWGTIIISILITTTFQAAARAASSLALVFRLRLRSEGPATRRLGVNGHPRVASNQTGCE